MFRDCWDYICYKIQDTILKNGQKQNRKKQENINRTTHRKAGFLLQKSIRDVSLPLPGQGITDAFVLFGFALSLRRHCRVSMHYRQNTWRGCAGK